jgi:mRNA interferase MazF
MSPTNSPKPSFTKDFDGWNEYKKKLENTPTQKIPLYFYDKKAQRATYRFKAGEIWYCSVGVNIGTEICGKNDNFERPVLIIHKSGRHFIALPLTSQKPNNQFFYYDISYTFDQKNVESYVLTNQPKSFDVLRLSRKVRRLNDIEFEKVKQKLKTYLSGSI